MSREQDLLFCKIAVSNNLVSQDDAQKCLAIASRFEAEGKGRPQVGQIFAKKSLLTDQDIARIYGAVKKRLEAQGAPQAAASAASGARHVAGSRRPSSVRAPGAAEPRRGRAVKRSGNPVAEGIDPKTLWIGIVFGVIAIGCLLAMVFLLVRSGEQPPPAESNIGIPKAQTPAAPAAPLPPLPLGAEKTPAKAAQDAKAAPEKAIRPEGSGAKEGEKAEAEGQPPAAPEAPSPAPAEK